MRVSMLIAFCLVFAAAAPALADEPPVRSSHEWRVGGQTLRYEATAGRLDLTADDGRTVRGHMFFVAYRPVDGAATRPVTFVWNGGPGAPSTTLHFTSIGPTRVVDGRVIDNPQSILAATDLVFVDAVGTGFSRAAAPSFEPGFYNTLGDIEAFASFVREWRRQFAAASAPVVLLGESFGAPRAAGVAARLLAQGERVDAAVLVSGGLGLGRAALPASLEVALRVPEWAAIAMRHGKGMAASGRSADAVSAEARAWAIDTYAPALERIGDLSDDARATIADRLASYVGLPASVVDRKSLVVTPRQFRTELLRDRGQTLPIFDLRRTSPVTFTPAHEAAMVRQLREGLRYQTALDYAGLDSTPATGPSVNERWDYFAPNTSDDERKAAIAEAVRVGGGPPGVSEPWIPQAFARNPKLRVRVATGRYDAGQCLQIAETVRRLDPPLRDAYTATCYEGGHMMYLDDDARVAFAGDLTALVRSLTR